MASLWTNFTTWFAGIRAEFILNFVDKDRWRLLWTGLQNTLLITLMACLLGVAIGILIAVIRMTYDNNRATMRPSFGRAMLSFMNGVCKVYTTIIRGTPVVIQLLIMYYIIFASSKNGLMVASFAFGLNSGAYVSEIFRGGFMAIEKGQLEAGRSLGLNYLQSMMYIITPQVFKNVLPTLANEFIALLKETSVAGYVAVADLTFGGNRIRGVTYSAFMPLIAVALIYLVIVMFLTWLVGKLERRLRQSDNR